MQERQQEGRTPIRPRRRGPNAGGHFLQNVKYHRKYIVTGSHFRCFLIRLSTFFSKMIQGTGASPENLEKTQKWSSLFVQVEPRGAKLEP